MKVSIGYQDCYIGDAEISYGGSKALEKAKLAAEIIKKRLEFTKVEYDELKIDFIGYNSLYDNQISSHIKSENNFSEIRLRVSARTKDKKNAQLVVNEVETLYTNGPSGGGGVSKKVSDIISICSIFIPRTDTETEVVYKEVL